jgi:osmotically-inducible protein OsmY
MRLTTIFAVVVGVCGLAGGTGCATMKKAEAEVETAVKKDPNALKGAEDEALLGAAKIELGKCAKCKGHNFDVTVKGGVATLTGTGPADAKAAAETAVKVPGVTKVTNSITVK